LLESALLAVFLSGLLFFGVGIAPVGIVDQPGYDKVLNENRMKMVTEVES